MATATSHNANVENTPEMETKPPSAPGQEAALPFNITQVMPALLPAAADVSGFWDIMRLTCAATSIHETI